MCSNQNNPHDYNIRAKCPLIGIILLFNSGVLLLLKIKKCGFSVQKKERKGNKLDWDFFLCFENILDCEPVIIICRCKPHTSLHTAVCICDRNIRRWSVIFSQQPLNLILLIYSELYFCDFYVLRRLKTFLVIFSQGLAFLVFWSKRKTVWHVHCIFYPNLISNPYSCSCNHKKFHIQYFFFLLWYWRCNFNQDFPIGFHLRLKDSCCGQRQPTALRVFIPGPCLNPQPTNFTGTWLYFFFIPT